ncbi:hypothetical protein HDV64DRAFT_254383 [Trichoderma sp. TUCIM 5745]
MFLDQTHYNLQHIFLTSDTMDQLMETKPPHGQVIKESSIADTADRRVQPWKASLKEIGNDLVNDGEKGTFQASPGFSCDSLTG